MPATSPTIPGYEVLGELGRGGMGVVYKARHLALGRIVAVKMLANTLPEVATIARFHAEIEAVARLQHANIIQIYEVGSVSTGPYFAMEHADSGSLADCWLGKPQPPRQAAEIVATIAEAVQAAHDAGIVHRDLKPSNILLHTGCKSPQNGRTAPAADKVKPVLKITDFGVARRLDTAGLTQSGQMMGTPGYMAPEQAQGAADEVGPPADIYALGILLYEALTGGPPHRGITGLETVHLMLSHDPLPPSRLRPHLSRDLETICLHCLEKEPQRRYPSARAVAEDLQRFLAGKPIVARPISSWERTWKWARRNPVIAILVALLLVTTCVGFGVVTALWRHAEAAQEHAEIERGVALQRAEAQARARREAQRLSAQLMLERGVSLCESGDHGPGLLWLARGLDMTGPNDHALHQGMRRILGGWSRQLPTPALHLSFPEAIHVAELSADGRMLAVACGDRVLLYDLQGRAIGKALVHTAAVSALALHPNGKVVASGAEDGSVRLWDVASGNQPGAAQQPAEAARPQKARLDVRALAFSPDGERLISGSEDGQVILWKMADGLVRVATLPHRGAVPAVAFSRDGRSLLTGSADGTARLWDTRSGSPLCGPLAHPGGVRAVALRPDGQLLATGGEDHVVRLWTAPAGQLVRELREHTGAVRALAFHPGRGLLVSGSEDSHAILWDLQTGDVRKKMAHENEIVATAFSPDGRFLVTASEDHMARLWRGDTGEPIGSPLIHQDDLHVMRISSDGRTILTAGEDHTVRLWKAPGAPQAITLPRPVPSVDFSPDGKYLAAVSGGIVVLCDLATSEKKLLAAGTSANVVAFRPDGQALLVGGGDDKGGVVQFFTSSGTAFGPALRHAQGVITAVFSPDGKTVAVGCYDPDSCVHLWDAERGIELRQLQGHTRKVCCVAFHPRAPILGSSSWDRTSRLWNTETGAAVGDVMTQQDIIQSIAFAPAGDLVVTAGDDYTARLWSASNGRPHGPPLRHYSKIEKALFSPSSTLIATSCKDGTVRLWDVTTSKPIDAPLPHPAGVHGLAFAPNGGRLAAACLDGGIRLYPVPQEAAGSVEDINLRLEALTGLQLDPTGLIVVLDSESSEARLRTLYPDRVLRGGDK
jgi:WD40 repeat protein